MKCFSSAVMTTLTLLVHSCAYANAQPLELQRSEARVDSNEHITRFNYSLNNVQLIQDPYSTEPSLSAVSDLLEDNRELLTPSTEPTFELTRDQMDSFGHRHLQYREVIHGVAIIDSEIQVHIDPAGVVTRVNGSKQNTLTALHGFMRQWSNQSELEQELLSADQIISIIESQESINLSHLNIVTDEVLLYSEAPFARRKLKLSAPSTGTVLTIEADAITGDSVRISDDIRFNIDPLASLRGEP